MMSLFGTKFSTPLAGGSRDSGDGRPRSGFTSGSNALPSGSAGGGGGGPRSGGGTIAVAGFSGTVSSSTNVLLASGSPRGGGGAPRSGGGIGGPRSGGTAAAASSTSPGSNVLPSGWRSPTAAGAAPNPDNSSLSASNIIVGATLDEESRSLVFQVCVGGG